MSRGWILIDENKEMSDDEYEQLQVKANMLAAEWSRLHDEDEQETFRLRAEAEDGWNDRDYDPDDTLIMVADEERLKLKRLTHEAIMRTIEERLEELGVRMMRPYEHHNEDEAYYEYMERDR